MSYCAFCGKKEERLELHKCRYCGLMVCSEHVLPENHKCTNLPRGWVEPPPQPTDLPPFPLLPPIIVQSPKLTRNVLILFFLSIVLISSSFIMIYDIRFQDGYRLGYTNGTVNSNSGYTKGLKDGNNTGYSAGYSKGLNDLSKYGYKIRDPTYAEAMNFVSKDTTNKNTYSSTYTCFNFCYDFEKNAFSAGYRCGLVYIEFSDDSAHGIVVFNTIDKGIIYIEPQDDSAVVVKVGINYSSFGKIVYFAVIW